MAAAGLTYDEVMAQSAQAQPQQGLVLDEAFDVIHQDNDKSEDEDFQDVDVEVEEDVYLGRCTSIFVNYPRRVVVSILLITILAMYATYLDNFSITVPSPYDWECPDDQYTLLRNAMASAADEADESKALARRPRTRPSRRPVPNRRPRFLIPSQDGSRLPAGPLQLHQGVRGGALARPMTYRARRGREVGFGVP